MGIIPVFWKYYSKIKESTEIEFWQYKRKRRKDLQILLLEKFQNKNRHNPSSDRQTAALKVTASSIPMALFLSR